MEGRDSLGEIFIEASTATGHDVPTADKPSERERFTRTCAPHIHASGDTA